MQIRATSAVDVFLEGHKKALWPGQVYDLPSAAAAALVREGRAEYVASPFRPLADEAAKAIEEPPRDKAIKPQRNKRRQSAKGGRRRP